MPPHVSRKRNASPAPIPPPKRSRTTGRGRSSVFDAVDAGASGTATLDQTKEYLNKLEDSDESDSGSDDDNDFEDVPGLNSHGGGAKDEAGEEEDEMDWENAIDAANENGAPTTSAAEDIDVEDVTVTLDMDGKYATVADRAASTLKKGPSKRERQVRNGTHCIHVQSLMWHNAMRNSWLNDKELQHGLVKSLPEGILLEVDKWKDDMGMPKDETRVKLQKRGKGKGNRQANTEKRAGRDWDVDAERQEKGVVNLSRGDPTLRLLKILTAYWRKRFTITAPGIRKLGYMPLKRLTQEINAWKKDKTDVQKHGERIDSVSDLKRLAKSLEGSRDVGAQLFTALLRGLGLETRMVANLQPAGIGWGKSEEAKPPKTAAAAKKDAEVDSGGEISAMSAKQPKKAPRPTKTSLTPKQSGNVSSKKDTRQSPRTSSDKVINLDSDSESSLSSAPSDMADDDSVVDITDTFTKQRPNEKFDRDMHYPNYWSEVLSPISNTWVPVDPVVLSTVATNGELLATFEPRGKRADQAKQVICYTVAHASDGSAKDVTVRYLKKHQLPGRTKGFRLPVEKIKVYNRKGKVRKYEEYDWFRTVMSVFERPTHLRTPADDLEESTDLKPFKPDTEKPKAEVESLQWYKQSADFVLERHLRREEAIPPWAKQVKMFKAGKGDNAPEEPVYRRSEVLLCKTAESWHKEGREIKFGEQPMKLVPMRAVTTMRKREMEEVERETGEKAKQGLFSRDQTDWIIPPPIGPDREIPKNAFGNIDVYVPSMVPKGAVHLPLKGAARICRDLKISHAEAVTGFEFGKRMAIPVITGVVVPEEHEKEVRRLWREKEAEKKRKEDEKRTQLCLGLWRKFFSGLRIVERMKKEYADSGREEDINPFVRKAKMSGQEPKKATKKSASADVDVDALGGGFMPEGDGTGSIGGQNGVEEDESDDDMNHEHIDIEGGGFIMDEAETHEPNGNSEEPTSAPITPMSMQSAHIKEDVDNDDLAGGFEREGLPPSAINEVSAATKVKKPANAKRVVKKPATTNGTVKRSGRASAAKAKTKMSETADVTLSEDDEDDLSSAAGEEESDSPPPTRKTKATHRASASKRKSPTKSQYFAEPGRRRSARNAK
ncbi:Rad4 transglutaminase-like domain-containing protein [Elsinoe ampelina]|uniref:Rad4 transglutaminase-like domain-containing protein n=1 Tax=Elsinoe ampelina TaxID=302913 RepID=A0A6A6GK91_9PEZI|nr:Rad4 transglutaminase-like domain-containing protein [Elsinoe ampelina]